MPRLASSASTTLAAVIPSIIFLSPFKHTQSRIKKIQEKIKKRVDILFCAWYIMCVLEMSCRSQPPQNADFRDDYWCWRFDNITFVTKMQQLFLRGAKKFSDGRKWLCPRIIITQIESDKRDKKGGIRLIFASKGAQGRNCRKTKSKSRRP